jgi:flavin reductase (DIM6/NTAB) family NADH-FMN oxidoreductase RutF
MSEDTIKSVLKRIPYGFYVTTSRANEDVNAMVMNWVTQVSFEPRQFALGLQKTSYSHGLIEKGKVFAINIFNKEDVDAMKPFTKGRAKSADKMKDVNYTEGPQTGCPILEDAAAYVECKVVAIYDTGGDHDIVVGEVVGAGVNKDGNVNSTVTLLDLGWSYAG